MNIINPYSDGKASLLKYVGDILLAYPFYAELGRPQPSLVDFDALGDETELPENDLYGLSDYSLINETGMHAMSAAVIISTKQDLNLFRLRELTNLMYMALVPTKIIPMWDAEVGERIGTITLQNGTHAQPLVKTKLRAYQNITIAGLVAPKVGPFGTAL